MPEASQKPEQANKVPLQGDHDRVNMLSLKADGTADQHNPEIIGDLEFAVAAAQRQFAEQAVSAVDVAERGVVSADRSGADTLNDTRDPLKDKHEAAAKASRAAAEKAITGLAGELAG